LATYLAKLGNHKVVIGSAGVVFGLTDGILLSDSGSNQANNTGNNVVENMGLVSSNLGIGISTKLSGNSISNAGVVEGFVGIVAGSVGSTNNAVINSGDVFGADVGVTLYGNGSSLINTKLIRSSNGLKGTIDLKSVAGETIKFLNSGVIKSNGNAILGGDGSEIITNDGSIIGSISLGGGDDVYDGGQGSVGQVYLGAGNDTAYGGIGDDTIDGGQNHDLLYGGGGDDRLIFDSGNDRGYGEAGDDRFYQIFGTAMSLSLQGGDGTDVYKLTLNGAPPSNKAELKAKIDLRSTDWQSLGGLWGQVQLSGIEDVTTLDGDDLIIGSNADNRFDAGGGNDTLEGGLVNDRLVGGADYDFARYAGSTGAKANLATGMAEAAGYGSDTLVGIEGLIGGSGADSFIGDGNDNTLVGNAGNDILDGGLQNDTLDGGTGIDTAVFSGVAGAEVSLAILIEQETGYGKDTLKDIENLTGGAGADKFTGSKVANILNGNAGNDTLAGGLGNDKLTGGSQADAFVFNTTLNAKSNVDTITDFVAKDDTIQLENAIFKKLTKPGVLSKSYLTIGTKAKDKDDYIVYDKAKGILYYDADGSGSGAAVKFAQLKKAAFLDYKDFLII